MSELRLAIRKLLKTPGFAAVAILTLALGLAANVIVFTLAKTVLLRPLYPDADRLLWVQLQNNRSGLREDEVSWREIADIRESVTSFDSIATFGTLGLIWEREAEVDQHPSIRVTPELLDLIGAKTALGRPLMPADCEADAADVVLLGHEFWREHLGGDPEVIGKTLRLDGKLWTVVGVLAPKVEFPIERAPMVRTGMTLPAGLKAFWVPFKDPEGPDLTSRGARMFLPLARLKPGATEAQARVELASLSARLAQDFPETNRDRRFELTTLRRQVLGNADHAFALLGAAVLGVLLICCANLANLLLARGIARQREFAVQLALGAGRSRIARAVLAEAMVIALAGGVLGAALAEGGLHAIRLLGSDSLAFAAEASLDAGSLGFALTLAIASACFFGLLPALRHSRAAGADALRAGQRTTGSPQVRAWQNGMLAGQVAVVLVLLAGAGLLLESFRRLMAEDLGYEPNSVLAVDLNYWNFESNEAVCQLYRRLHARLSALPGVQAVGTISSAPLTGAWSFDEKAQILGENLPEADRQVVTARFAAFDYFQAMGIALVEGRLFRDSELKDSGYGQIVVLNESAAAALFPGRSAVGGKFTVGSNPDRVLEVIGVVKDTRDLRLEMKPRPMFYWQYAFGGAQLVIRSSVSERALAPMVRETIRQADSRILGQSIRTMNGVVSKSVAERRFLMSMLAVYAAVALVIAMVGVAGVISCQVAQRTNEFGVRLALGSSRGQLLRLVLLQTGRLVAAGVFLGAILSLASNRLLESQLYEISPGNPSLLLLAGSLIVLAALAASVPPARRAAAVDPNTALRYE